MLPGLSSRAAPEPTVPRGKVVSAAPAAEPKHYILAAKLRILIKTRYMQGLKNLKRGD